MRSTILRTRLARTMHHWPMEPDPARGRLTATMSTHTRTLTLLSLLGVLSACAATPSASEPGGAPDSAPPSVGDGSVPASEVPAAMLERVIADAASGAGVDPSDVTVIAAEAVTWSDGSLGCPEPGMMYTQALVPGYRVVLEIDGEELHFHAAQDGQFTFCENPQPPADGGGADR